MTRRESGVRRGHLVSDATEVDDLHGCVALEVGVLSSPDATRPIWARGVSNGVLGAVRPIFENLRAQIAVPPEQLGDGAHPLQ